jgi:hypothetical protein
MFRLLIFATVGVLIGGAIACLKANAATKNAIIIQVFI